MLKIKYKIIEIIHILSNYTSNRLNHSSNPMAEGGVMSFSHGGGGGNSSSPRWGVPFPVMMGGTPSSHGGGTNLHIGWVNTISGMGWVGYPIPGLGYQPYLGGTYPG